MGLRKTTIWLHRRNGEGFGSNKEAARVAADIHYIYDNYKGGVRDALAEGETFYEMVNFYAGSYDPSETSKINEVLKYALYVISFPKAVVNLNDSSDKYRIALFYASRLMESRQVRNEYQLFTPVQRQISTK